MPEPIIDVLALIYATMIGTVACLLWLFHTAQPAASCTWRAVTAIVARLTVVILISFAVMCVGMRLSSSAFAIVMTLILALAIFASHHGVPADGAFEFALANAIMLPIYLLKQFVLGFPDRDILTLRPPAESPARNKYSHLLHASGTVQSTLKPSGTVLIDDVVYPATTDYGNYLEAGTPILVSETRNSLLIVTVASHRN